MISLKSLQALRTIATATALIAPIMAATSVLAADDKAAATVEEPKVVLGPAPTDFGLKLTDYYDDCQKVSHQQQLYPQELAYCSYCGNFSLCSGLSSFLSHL